MKKLFLMIKRMYKKLMYKKKLSRRYTMNGFDYKSLPDKLNYQQTKIVEIFKDMLYNKKSKLSYNVKSDTACIKLIDNDAEYYMFINEDNVRIINTVHAYDTAINSHIFGHLMWLFYNKQNIEFTKFVKASNSKINHSLDNILTKVRETNEK